MSETTIIFEPEGRRVRASIGQTILQIAYMSGIGIRSDCGTKGTCGKCTVIIENQKPFNGITVNEISLLSKEEIHSGYRLACQTVIQMRTNEKITVMIPKNSRLLKRKFQVRGKEMSISLSPSIKKYSFSLQKPTLEDITPDLERIFDALTEKNLERIEVDYGILQNLPFILRDANWNVTTSIWDHREIISIEAGDTTKKIYGLAIDIGTSKIVSHLVDLNSGRTLETASIENPQIMFGEDIITRIAYIDKSYENLKHLQRIVVDAINDTIKELCGITGTDPDTIYEAIIAGNTVMHHIFLAIWPRFLGLSPFPPVVRKMVTVNSKQIGMKVNQGGKITALPVIAGFVGADAIADLIASKVHESDETSLLVDIGTNTEVFLSTKGDILSCSCASGPAFEGAHISQGMKAVTGAIDKIWFDRYSKLNYRTIDNVEPLGLCGSGLIDVIAELFRHRLISSSGRFNLMIENSKLRKIGNELNYVIAEKNESGTGKDIGITEKDINELQLAKAAIFTGISILMKRKNIDNKSIDSVSIAGAFGNNIDYKNAKTIGLIPDVPIRKIQFIGNASVTGAKMALLSQEIRQEAIKLSEKVRYLELTVEKGFSREFMEALYIPHKDTSRFHSVKQI